MHGDDAPVHRVGVHVARLVRRRARPRSTSVMPIAASSGFSGSVPRVQPSATSSTHAPSATPTSDARCGGVIDSTVSSSVEMHTRRRRRARRRRAPCPSGSARASAPNARCSPCACRVPTSVTDLAPAEVNASMLGGTLTRGPSQPRPRPRACCSRAAPRSTGTTSTRAASASVRDELRRASASSTRSAATPCARATATRSTRLRGREQGLELGQLVLRQVREDAAAVVVDDDERRRRERRARRAGRSCRAGSRGRRTSATTGPGVRAGDADDRRDEAVDAVRAAVREHAHAGARRHAPLERAHGQARRDDERAAVGNRGRDVARDAAFARDVVVEHVDRARRGPAARRPSHVREPRRRAGAGAPSSPVSAASSASASARDALVRGVLRIEPARRRGRRARSGRPSSHAFAILLVSGAPTRTTRSGRCAAANASTRSSAS